MADQHGCSPPSPHSCTRDKARHLLECLRHPLNDDCQNSESSDAFADKSNLSARLSDDVEDFQYSALSKRQEEQSSPATDSDEVESEEEDNDEFTYPDASSVVELVLSESEPDVSSTHVNNPKPVPQGPSPSQLEALYATATAGDLSMLQQLFQSAQINSHTEAFALANDASSRTGLTALHAAASRGHLETVEWRLCFLSFGSILS